MHFESDEHQAFYFSCLDMDINDCYRRSLFYLIGATDTTRRYVSEIYDFNLHQIKVDCLNKAWQTTGTQTLCRMAFNLYNGFFEPLSFVQYTPYDLFSYGSLMDVLIISILIRFELID